MNYRKRSFLIVMKVIGLLVSLAVSMPVQSQQTLRFHFDERGFVVPPEHAAYYRIAVFDPENFRFNGAVRDYFMNDTLKMIGNYTKGLLHGPFTFFFPNGTIESQGNYINGRRNGRWEYFYDNGQPRWIAYFSGPPDQLEDFVITESYTREGKPVIENGTGKWEIEANLQDFFFQPGMKRITGEFRNGQKHGTFRLIRVADNELLKSDRFNRGRFVFARYHDTPFGPHTVDHEVVDKFPDLHARRLLITSELRLNADYFPASLQDADCATLLSAASGTEVRIMNRQPSYPYGEMGLALFLSRNIRYPIDALRRGITGRVQVKVTVDPAGRPIELKIAESAHEFLDQEAKRVVGLIPRWRPAFRDGVPAEANILVPVSFFIGGRPPRAN